MIYVVDNLFNYFIYLFILSFGFLLPPRKNRLFLGASVLVMFLGAGFNWYFDRFSPLVYILWTVLSISLFFEARLWYLVVLSAALIYFTSVIDTFSVILLQIVLIGRGVGGIDLAWWMEAAYPLSFFLYLFIYLRLLKKNEVYLCDIQWKYHLALLIQGGIFQMFYNFIFFAFEENYEIYTLDTYVVFAISILGVAHSIFLTLNLAIKNLLSDRQNRELRSFMQMQQQQYDYQLKQSVQVRSFKHDLVNHIGVLRELISENRTEKAKEYIDRIWELQNEFDLKIHTGDSFLDVIVNYYGYLAEKEKIDFTVGGQITDKLGLEMFDITTLVGNILQNAVEAAKKTTAPKIRMELIEHKKEIFIVVKNSVCRAAGLQKDFLTTSKPDKEEHGFGLKNIAETVEKYQGEYYMDFLTEKGENLFQISISIPKGEPL
jgi:hypothetical protein